MHDCFNGRLNSRLFQFLDEADLLADDIAILAAPGKLVAQGSPVALKSSLGQGYTIQVRFHHTDDEEKLAQLPSELLQAIQTVAPQAYVKKNSPLLASYHLMSKDTAIVENALQVLDQRSGVYLVDSYDIRGTSVEDIFLDLMNREENKEAGNNQDDEIRTERTLPDEPIELSASRKRTPMSQTLTIFYKRALITRRAWLPLVMSVFVAIAGSCIPLVFLNGSSPLSCVRTYQSLDPIPLFLPALPMNQEVLIAPASIAAALDPLVGALKLRPISDNEEFTSTIRQNYRNIPFGGISFDLSSGQPLIAWQAGSPGTSALTLLNLASNVMYNARLNATSPGTASIIGANYASFPQIILRGLGAFRWMTYFATAMVRTVVLALYPR